MADAPVPDAPGPDGGRAATGRLLDEPLLRVRGLTVEYETEAGPVRAVDGFDLDVFPGEFVGVVGESGCGKSTLLFAIAQLLSPPAAITAGSVDFRGQNLVTMTEKRINVLRWRELSVVMQSAMNALNPVTSIAAQFKDTLRAHGMRSKDEIHQRSVEEQCGITTGHRGWNRQPLGGLPRSGGRPGMPVSATRSPRSDGNASSSPRL